MKVASFGEIMLRLSAGSGRISDCKAYDACYGGTEANVLACLSGFGHETRYLTALPDTELGDAAIEHLRGFGIDVSCIKRGGDVLGLYFVGSGEGSRGSNVIYYRKNSEAAKLDEDAFDYAAAFDGVDLFHVSGISFALSASCTRLAFRLLEEAKKRNIRISFDFNYRAKLWTADEAKKQFRKVMDYADVVLASPLDLDVFLQVSEEEYPKKYPGEYLFLRERKVLGADRHSVRVTAYGRGERCVLPVREFAVKERIGGGDAFDGGVLHGILAGADLNTLTRFAVSAFILKHSVAGDTFTMSADEVSAFAEKLF